LVSIKKEIEMQLKTLAASIMLVLSSPVMADIDDDITEMAGFYGSVGLVSLETQNSAAGYIDDSATYFKLGWEQHQQQWIWGAGLSVYLYSDNAGFTQETTEGDKESGASSVNGYLEGGYKYSLNDHVSLSILAGYEQVFASSREIGMCYDCHSEDIDMSAGLYIQPRASYLGDNDWYVTAAYNSYLSGDVEGSLFLTVGVLY